ncbi:hypothetical protein HY412_02385 [Candidatus Kaiserbacteria bacterium]|nr:hypothetical protein [Candidatus Kaiserbacteria bacterium]
MRYNLANELWNIGAVLTKDSDSSLVVTRGQERGFLSKTHEDNPGAPLLPIFLNFRTPDNPRPGPLTPDIVNLSARCLYMMIGAKGLDYDAIAGVPRAGGPFAESFCKIENTTCIPMYKWEYGGKRRIESLKDFVPVHVKRVIVIDDVVHKGRSKVETVMVIRDGGLEVTDIVVLADYELGGRNELAKLSCNLHSVFAVRELVDFFAAEEKMPSQLRDEIQAYLAQPA